MVGISITFKGPEDYCRLIWLYLILNQNGFSRIIAYYGCDSGDKSKALTTHVSADQMLNTLSNMNLAF